MSDHERRKPSSREVQGQVVSGTEDLMPIPIRHSDPVSHLRELIGDDPEALRVVAQERMRVRLTHGLRRGRLARGLTQQDLAARLAISQGRVSRLESADLDRRMDSVVAYAQAAEVELLMAFRVGDQVIEVVGSTEGWRAAGESLGSADDPA